MLMQRAIKQKPLPNLVLYIGEGKTAGEQSRLMRMLALIGTLLLFASVARADLLLPTAEGTTWRYESVEELGGPAAGAPTTTSVIVRVGRYTFAGQEFIKVETATDQV